MAYDHAAGDHGHHRHQHREAEERTKLVFHMLYESGSMKFFHKKHFKLYFPRGDSRYVLVQQKILYTTSHKP
jgi:hypothetical protein